MESDEDYLFALRLQNELDALDDQDHAIVETNKRKRDEFDLNATQNIVNPHWEDIDPTPDIHSLFGAFDLKFFRGKLKCVELEWSKKMFQCAGICYQRRNRMGMSIIIRLSEPLLKLRTRRNLIETLLHEMIHAYLFVQNIREPNGGHGPNFKKMMTDINKVAGTNITVYHTFHDEVAVYQTHIWRCNGICQHRKPFYGWVKRTRNLAPGPRDFWWAKHHETCGGTFQKVSEPEPKSKQKKAKISENTTAKKDIEKMPKMTDYWSPSNPSTSAPKSNNTFGKMNGGGTVLLKPTTQNRTSTVTSATTTSVPTQNKPNVPAQIGGNLSNVVGFRDLNSSDSAKKIIPFGHGKVLGSSNQPSSSAPPVDKIRSIWANKFNTSTNSSSISSSSKTIDKPVKTNVTEATSNWEEIDDDILVHAVQDTIITIDDDDDDSNSNSNSANNDIIEVKSNDDIIEVKPKLEKDSSVLQKSIKEELLEDLGEDPDDIQLIDDEFNDDLANESFEMLADTSVINELFGFDDLLNNFNEINSVVMTYPENKGDPNKEIISCPICQDNLPREQLTEHLDGCSGITVKIEPRKRQHGGKKETLPFYKNKVKPPTEQKQSNTAYKKQLLRNAGYDEQVINGMFNETDEAREYNDRIMREMLTDDRQRPAVTNNVDTVVIDPIEQNEVEEEKVPCPVCNVDVNANEINQHLDICLQGMAE